MPKENRKNIEKTDKSIEIKSICWHFICEYREEFNYKIPTHQKISFKRRFEYNVTSLFSFKRKDYTPSQFRSLPRVVFIQWKKMLNNLVIGFIEYTLPISSSVISNIFEKDIRLDIITRQTRVKFDDFCSIENEPHLTSKCKNCKKHGHDEYNCFEKFLNFFENLFD